MDDMENILEQINIIQKRLDQLNRELEETTINGIDPGDRVVTTFNGNKRLLDIQLKDYQLEPELKQSLIQALNQGITRAGELAKSRKRDILEDLDIPDIPGL